jgi:hypothetical protein
MARAGVGLVAVCLLPVALATVYFQEEFLDGGEGAGAVSTAGWTVAEPRGPPSPNLTLTRLPRVSSNSCHFARRAMEKPMGAVHQ